MGIVAKCSHCSEPFEKLVKFCPNCGLSVFGEGFTDKAGVAIHDLFEIAMSFSSIADMDMLLEKISSAAERLTQSEASSVMLLDSNKEFLSFRTAGGEKGKSIKTIKIPVGHGISGWVAQKGAPLLIEDVSKDERFSASLADDKSGFKTRSILCVPLMVSNEVIGVMEVLNKTTTASDGKFTSDDQEILTSLAGFAAVTILNSRLNMEQKNFFANVIEIIIASTETRSKNPSGHCWRVAQTSCAIARRLQITGNLYKTIYYASLVHDVGYVGVARDIRAKNIVLSSERIEHLHPDVGAEMTEPILLLEDCAPLIRAHHEYWDGSGFPNKLKGEEIPLGARIIALAEAVEDSRLPGIQESEFQVQAEQFVTANVDKFFDPNVVAAYLLELHAKKEGPQ